MTDAAQQFLLTGRDHISGFGPVHKFIEQFNNDPSLQKNPQAIALHKQLIAKASVCSFCGVGCPFTVIKTSSGKKRLVPMSSLGLCVKGVTSLHSGDVTERAAKLKRRGIDNDRITAPMIRNHDGQMKEVSWEEALDRAAWLFLHTREWVGPEAVAIYGNGQKTIESIWMAGLYKLVFNIATIGANSEHCLASAGAAHEQNFGNEASFTWQEFDELEHCDVVVLHGTNPSVTFPQAFEKLKANKHALKVVIDPVQSDTVRDLQAYDPRTLHIRFEQGGDILFNLAVARIIFENGWEDKAYLQRAVDQQSVEAMRKLCFEERFAPNRVAERIVLDGDSPIELTKTIRRYAALLAKPLADGHRPRPAFVSSMGINQSTGSFGFSSNLNLLLLTGNVGRKGAGSLRIAGQSNATSELSLGFNSRRLMFNLDPSNELHRKELASVLDIPLENIPTAMGTPVAKMADDDYIYCFIFIGTQMTRNMPRLGHWTRRMGRAFNIVIDSFLADGVLDHADVILPAFSHTERNGVIQRGDRSLQLQQQITQPPAQSWSDEQILARLALAIARRLQDPSTAALNSLDPKVVTRAFGRYVDDSGYVEAARVFDHIVETSHQLDMYNRFSDADGTPASHERLRVRAGKGVQWQGDGRYGDSRKKGGIFPRLHQQHTEKARLVLPPEELLVRLVRRDQQQFRSLITGRGRPGHLSKHYRGRYNSGIKTLPITGKESMSYWLEVNPVYAEKNGLVQDQFVRISSQHSIVFAKINLNPNVPEEFPFADFVPGEINRLTNYLEADKFTNQSLIKRTPIRIEALSAAEKILWQQPNPKVLKNTIMDLYQHFIAVYPQESAWEAHERGEAGAVDWLPLNVLHDPQDELEHKLAASAGAMSAFLQQYLNDKAYRAIAKPLLAALADEECDRFLTILLPLLRKLDYHSALLTLLSDVVGSVRLANSDGSISEINLKDAHQAAVLELKEEVVAAQLFVAIKRGVEVLFGEGAPVPRDDLAFVSGIAIPCAGDVPAFFMGINPFDLDSRRLIHSRSIGIYSILVVDRRQERAVKMDIKTGVLPKDEELRQLRGAVIVKKRAASRWQHRRFFDRLGELIVKFIREGDENYHIYGPVEFSWDEYRQKLAFVPSSHKDYRDFLLKSRISLTLAQSLLAMNVLDKEKDADLIQLIANGDYGAGQTLANEETSLADLLANNELSCVDKIHKVINGYIEPVLKNDGGRIEFIDFNENEGEVSVRFLGSCANCPYSMLSLETLVIPPLMSIPGVLRVSHRGFLREGEKKQVNFSSSKPVQDKIVVELQQNLSTKHSSRVNRNMLEVTDKV